MSAHYYDELFSEVEAELYIGCLIFPSLYFLVKLIYLKVLYKWTNKSFDSLLKLLKDTFLKENKIPGSYNDTKKWIKIGIQIRVHSCL